MTTCKCGFSQLKENQQFRKQIITGYDPKNENPWVYVPREPATFGHLIVVSGKCYRDISDKGLCQDIDHMKRIMKVICELASVEKQHLVWNGRKCERVYIVSESETPNLHLHFHLIPRFQGDKEGHIYLFERELEEARWKLKTSINEDKIRDAHYRISEAEGILNFHKSLVCLDRWLMSDTDRLQFIDKIKSKIDRIVSENIDAAN